MIKIKILKEGDKVLGFSDNKILVHKPSGEAVLFLVEFDSDNLPIVRQEKTCLITFGDFEVQVSDGNSDATEDIKVSKF